MKFLIWMLAILLLLTGTGFFLFPSAEHYIQDQETKQLVRDFEKKIQHQPRHVAKASETRTQPDSEVIGNQTSKMASLFNEDKQSGKNMKKTKHTAVTSTIYIPRISQKLPIFEGITEGNMAAGIAHMTGTAAPGEKGNAVYAGHRSYSYGRLWNRLNEVEKGDEIVINTLSKTYIYDVTRIEVVDPANHHILSQPLEKTEITLITCTPVRIADHRLIIKAELRN